MNINRSNEQNAAIILNDVILVLVFLISIINVIISAFGIEHSSKPMQKIRNWWWIEWKNMALGWLKSIGSIDRVLTFFFFGFNLLSLWITLNHSFIVVYTKSLLFSFFSLSLSLSPTSNNSYSFACQVSAACLSVVLATINLNKSDKHREMANRLVHLSLGFVFVSTFCNVVSMNFGLDPAN